jgi:hypothetical protein
MRGTGFGNIMAQNVAAVRAQQRNEKRMNSKWKCCWRCQKDKDPRGGFLRIQAGLHKFICKDCMDAKQKQLEEKTNAETKTT